MNARISGIVLFVMFACAALLLPGVRFASVQTRTIEIHEQELLKDVLKIEVQNPDSPEFPKGFGVKVTNLTNKPIYHIHVAVVYRGTAKLLGGIPLGATLAYGPPELVDLSRVADQRGESIKPGESFVLTLNADRAAEDKEKLDELFPVGGVEKLTSVFLSFTAISFGDGTGYQIGKEYPRKNGTYCQTEYPFTCQLDCPS